MNAKEILAEFKTFVTKGNVIDLAVGVLIGATFGDVVKSFTTGIIQPIVTYVGGGDKITLHVWIFDVGLLLTSLMNFAITAAVLFFVFVKPMNEYKARTAKKEEAVPPPPPEDVLLLREIRDLLKAETKLAPPPLGAGGTVV